MENSKLHYSDYLKLDSILNAQVLESTKKGKEAHDEMLFIIIHQAYELWFKQILFEIGSIKDIFMDPPVNEKDLGLINSRLERVVKILNLLVDQVSIIETMRPQSFLDFRDFLVPASGFQSLQFRLLETHLGLTWKDRGQGEKVYFNSRLKDEELETLNEAMDEPSLLTLVDQWLDRLNQLDLGMEDFWKNFQEHIQAMLKEDKDSIEKNPTLSPEEKKFELINLQSTMESFQALFDDEAYTELLDKGEVKFRRKSLLAALFINLYQDYPLLHLPFILLKHLVEIDQLLTKWRQGHAIMVKRMLGTKIGTGGSSGHEYLRKTAERHSVFSDLFNLSSFLLPKSKLPILPTEVQKNLSYHFDVKRKGL